MLEIIHILRKLCESTLAEWVCYATASDTDGLTNTGSRLFMELVDLFLQLVDDIRRTGYGRLYHLEDVLLVQSPLPCLDDAVENMEALEKSLKLLACSC